MKCAISTVFATLIAAPVYAFGVCATEVVTFREASIPVWATGNAGVDPSTTNVYAIESSWSKLEGSDLADPKDKRQLKTLLYTDLNNVVKPKFSDFVSPELLELLGTAIRCVKEDIRSAPRDEAKDSTAGLDFYFSKKVESTFGVQIDLGEPL